MLLAISNKMKVIANKKQVCAKLSMACASKPPAKVRGFKVSLDIIPTTKLMIPRTIAILATVMFPPSSIIFQTTFALIVIIKIPKVKDSYFQPLRRLLPTIIKVAIMPNITVA